MFSFKIIAIITICLLVLQQTDSQSVESCGTLDEELLYGNETIAAPNEYPWIVLIGYRRDDKPEEVKYYCQGVILSKRLVITANHCLENVIGNITEVLVGDWTSAIQQVAQTYEVDEIIHNPTYDSKKILDDIALLHLARDIVFRPRVQPICLPPPELTHNHLISKHLYLAGMKRAKNPNAEERIKLKNFAHVMSPLHCTRFFVKFFNSEKHICAYPRNAIGILMSGSPLMDVKVIESQPRYFYLVGLVSFGGRDMQNFDGYASILPHLSWLKYFIKLAD